MMIPLKTLPKTVWGDMRGKAAVVLLGLLLTWLVGAFGFAWNRAVAIYRLPDIVEAHSAEQAKDEKRFEELKAGQAQQSTILNKLYRQAQTFTGTAKVGDFDGEAIAQVNVIGNAADYTNESQIRVTNLSSHDTPSSVIKIEGTFRSDDRQLLIRLSKSAAAKLDISGTAQVKVEPADK